jgi:uncharacterized membrane protein
MRHFPGPYSNGMGIWFGVAGFIGTLLVIGLIVALVVILSRRNKQPGTHPASPPVATAAALIVLDHRLATGEIDIADYQARKAALLGEAPPRPDWTPTPPVAEDAAPPSEDPKA